MNYFSRVGALFFTGFFSTVSAWAQFGTASPTYNYPVSVIQGNQPLVAGSAVLAGSDPITLIISQPTKGMAGVTYPLTINLAVTIPSMVGANPGVPIGGNRATAIGYCTLSSASVTFSSATATAQVIVSVNVPTPEVSGNFYWKVAGTNWPVAVSDPGAIINAVVLPPIINPTVPPSIINLMPTPGTSFIFNAPAPVSIPISFDATSVSAANGGAAITGLKAQFDTTSLTLSTMGLGSTNSDGTFSASASVTTAIANAGPHTITVTATNAAGSSTAKTQINIFAPPAITSANATTFTYSQLGTFNVTATGYPAPTYSVSGALPAGVTLNTTTGVLSGTPTAAVGAYPFTITATNPYGANSQNFTLTVKPLPITVTAAAVSKVYGAADPALTYSVTSGTLAAGDSLSGSLSRAVGSNVGSYAISQGTLASSSNYTLTFVAGTLSITSAPLTVTANNATMLVGGPIPSFSATITGFVGSDTLASSVTGAPAFSTTPTPVNLAGLYQINVSAGNVSAGGLVSKNYSFVKFVPGTLTVSKANQTITFGALSSVAVNSAPFALSATASSGLAVTYTSSNLAVATVSGSTITVLSAGSSVITASQAGNDKYNAAASVSQTLTVTAVQSCATSILWLTPVSQNCVQQGGSSLPIKFTVQECCPSAVTNPCVNSDGGDDRSSGGDNNSSHDGNQNSGGDDNRSHDGNRSSGGDDHSSGCYKDAGGDDDGSYDRWHSGHSNDTSGGNVSCHHRSSDGKSSDDSKCQHDCNHQADDNHDGCVSLRDTTVIMSIYEVGSSVSATQYKYGTGSPNPPYYIIDGDYKYQLNFPTAKGTHKYHIDIYRFAPGSTIPTLVGSKEFTTNSASRSED